MFVKKGTEQTFKVLTKVLYYKLYTQLSYSTGQKAGQKAKIPWFYNIQGE